MTIWAIGDLHLAFSVPNKSMEVFGKQWEDYPSKIAANWKKSIRPEDLVLIPGDISWAMHLKEALIDLQWIDALPGKKILLKGNHDYWWPSSKKLRESLPLSIGFVHKNAIESHQAAIAGSRLWDTKEFSFGHLPSFPTRSKKRRKEEIVDEEVREKIYQRELLRLEKSLCSMSPHAAHRIALTHYPPIGEDLAPSRASALFEKYQIDVVIFGHLHNLIPQTPPLFGRARGVHYVLASADYLQFQPIEIC